MRKMFLMLTLMLTIGAFASDTTKLVDNFVQKSGNGVETVYNDGKELAKIVSGKAEIVITELAKSLKVTTHKVWEILVRQQRVWAWGYLIGMITAIGSWVHFYYRLKKFKNEVDVKGKTLNSNLVLVITTFVISLTLSIFSMIHFNAMLTGFLNPEFSAMTYILELAKNLK